MTYFQDFTCIRTSDIDDPVGAASLSSGSSVQESSAGQVETVSEMGFTPAQARKALRETVDLSYAGSNFAPNFSDRSNQ